MIDDVSCEDDGIASLIVYQIDDGLYIILVAVAESSSMEIRELSYPITVKCLWKVGEIECLLMHHVLMSAYEISVADEEGREHGECHPYYPEASSENVVLDYMSYSVKDSKQGFWGKHQ